ncbi:hypothetical protein L1787_12700 [Acuticoccus sp. M5D2P5]|uniref:hypothetical protein n=1 Tax=Acuticoccus kalidii TaxID=2910977 RepID=UPI001F1D7A13|nr:hypothetical protein [Acuticoccus kalidii]MCF3934268.1 hypothetical protein [Acuticoccus kalidii]
MGQMTKLGVAAVLVAGLTVPAFAHVADGPQRQTRDSASQETSLVVAQLTDKEKARRQRQVEAERNRQAREAVRDKNQAAREATRDKNQGARQAEAQRTQQRSVDRLQAEIDAENKKALMPSQ